MLEEHPQVSVVVPLFNEAGCLEANVALLEDYLRTIRPEYEVVLVNDGSTDATQAISELILSRSKNFRLISYPANRGKGYAVKTGVLNSRGEYIIFTDADLAVPVGFIGGCLRKLENGVPIVIGSRHLSDSVFIVRENPFRQLLGEIFRRFAQWSLGLKVSDITCGLKGFHKKAAVDIFSRSRINRWGYDAEILFLAQRFGYFIDETPVEWRHSFDSKVRVGVDSIRTLMEILRIFYYYLSGRYL